MPSIFSAYQDSQKQPAMTGSPRSAFGAYSSQRAPYQSVAGAAMASAGAKRGAELDQGRHQSYMNYLGDVISGTVDPTEGDQRAPYIPLVSSNVGYRGSNFIDQNVAMSRGAIPAAYEFADISSSPMNYGVSQLEWGGPTSRKTQAKDFLDANLIRRRQGEADDSLRRAIVPEYLRDDVTQGLGQKWTKGFDSEFNRLKGERAAAQQQWWSGADWANKSLTPGWVETVKPDETRVLAPETSIYHEATRKLTKPEERRVLQEAKQVWREPTMSQLTPEQQVWREATREVVTPESTRMVDVPESWGRDDEAWRQYLDQLDASQIYPGQDRHFYYKDFNGGANRIAPTIDTTGNYNKDAFRWQVRADGEEMLHDRALGLLDAYYRSLDPRTAMQGGNPLKWGTTYQSGVDYPSDWGAYAGRDLWAHAGNNPVDYDAYLRDPNAPLFNPDRIDYQFDIPLSVFTHSPASQRVETVPAEYRDVPGYWETVAPTYQEATPGYWENLDAVYETIPAQYEDVPAWTEIVPPVTQVIPGVYRQHPSSLKQGFQTIVDPITGVAIPNWYLSGSSMGNPDLSSAYGAAPWYLR